MTSLAQFFLERSWTNAIVLVTDDPKAAATYPSETPLFIALLPEGAQVSESVSLPANCRLVTPSDVDPSFLEDKILVFCAPLVRNLSRLGRAEWKRIRALASDAHISIFPSEQRLLRMAGPLRRRRQANETTLSNGLISIGGRAAEIQNADFPPVSVLAFLSVFNERDMIAYTIRYLLGQGVDVHVLDNWSTDGSYEIVAELAACHPDRVTVERFPEEPGEHFLFRDALRRMTKLARTSFARHHWMMLTSADELRRSPWLDITLQEAISFVDSCGYNCIDYTLFNFQPTEEGFDEGDDPSGFFCYGEFASEPWAFAQVNTWQNSDTADLSTHGGHLVVMNERRVFPLKFLLQHYSLRSSRQARRKIFRERLPRYAPDELAVGWHTQYEGFREDQSFLRDPSELIEFRLPAFYADYLIERVSGLGIKRNP